jgi:molybdopterin converting factor small subunit
MRIQLLHFASFRDALGRQEESREVPPGSRVSDVWAALATEVPRFREFASIPPAALNREYVRPETVLSDGDELAFLPPVAGG